MLKLNLLIADPDQAYVERLTQYLNNNEAQRFSMSYVTSKEALMSYFDKRGQHIDLLLVHPSFAQYVGKQYAVTAVLLSDGRIHMLDKDKHVINKYMRGDLIASQLIEIYTNEHPEHLYLNQKQRTTHTIAVYSPLGGVGKSLIAAASAMTAKKMGKTVFYLNLEDGTSTACFFNGSGFPSVSELIYYLKEKKDQLNVKVEALAFKDPESGVKSFAPPETLADMAELSESEIEHLILSVMQSGNDLLMIDLSNSMNAKNMKALELADQIFLVGKSHPMASIRMNQFMKHIKVVEKRKGMSLIHKMHYVENQVAPGSVQSESVDASYRSLFKSNNVTVYDAELNQYQEHGVTLSGTFGRDIQRIMHSCLKEEG